MIAFNLLSLCFSASALALPVKNNVLLTLRELISIHPPASVPSNVEAQLNILRVLNSKIAFLHIIADSVPEKPATTSLAEAVLSHSIEKGRWELAYNVSSDPGSGSSDTSKSVVQQNATQC